MTSHTVRVVLITAPNEDTAEKVAKALVEERLAACVNVLPGVRSIYRWQGRVEDERELLLVVKTATDRMTRLMQRVQEIHPYACPEVLALPVDAGTPAYLDWVIEETRGVVY